MFKKAFDFFIFSSLYIALCAVLMTVQTLRVLAEKGASLNLLLFIFFSTICSYNFHWYLTSHAAFASDRLAWTTRHRHWHVILYFVGLSGSVFYFYLLKDHWMAISFGAIVTFLYSAPKLPQTVFKGIKTVAIGKTFFLAFVWTYVTTALPLILSDIPWRNEFALFMLGRFFLIYGICILFDYRDREDDKTDNIRSMITYLNEQGINNLFILCMTLFAGATLSLFSYHFQGVAIILLLIPGVIVSALFDYAKKNFSDYLYYFVLDGLMMFSALLMLVFRI